MSQESGATRFLAPSPSDDVTVKDTNTRSKFTYTREFLLSFAKLDITELPGKIHLSVSRVIEDACGLLSLRFCDSDYRCDKSLRQHSSPKVLDNVNYILHRSNEPYWPPCRYKALAPSSRDSNDFHNNEMSGSSDCTSQRKATCERWRKGLHEEKSYAEMVSLPKEDKWHLNEHIDSEESSEVFLMASAKVASGNFNLHSNSKEITKQLDTSHQPSLIQEASRGYSLQPFVLPETTGDYSTQLGLVQNVTEACSNPNVRHPNTTPYVMESQKKSRPPSFLNQENCGNENLINHFEAVDEKAGMELRLSNTSVSVHGSPGKIAKTEASEGYLSPPVRDRLYRSMLDKCDSSMARREGIFSVHAVKQVDSISMKQNPSSPDVQIKQELELNSFSRSDGVSNSGSELCLPEEDSLITFDGPFLMPDDKNWSVVGDSIPSPESNQIKGDLLSPSSPRDMIEKLVESVLNDDSSPAPQLNDSQVHHEAGLEAFCHSSDAPQSFTHFCPYQDTVIDTSTFSSITLPLAQSFPLSPDKVRKFDHDASHAMFKQMANPDKLHICFYCAPHREGKPNLPTQQVASCPRKLNSNSMQDCILGCHEPSYVGFVRPNADSHPDRSNNQELVDSLSDMKLEAWHWQPHVGGFSSGTLE